MVLLAKAEFSERWHQKIEGYIVRPCLIPNTLKWFIETRFPYIAQVSLECVAVLQPESVWDYRLYNYYPYIYSGK